MRSKSRPKCPGRWSLITDARRSRAWRLTSSPLVRELELCLGLKERKTVRLKPIRIGQDTISRCTNHTYCDALTSRSPASLFLRWEANNQFWMEKKCRCYFILPIWCLRAPKIFALGCLPLSCIVFLNTNDVVRRGGGETGWQQSIFAIQWCE